MEDNTFKIIKIIDEYNIVVNAGSNYDIKEDDKLEVFIKGEPVKDPDTNEILGTLDAIKAKLKVKQVFHKFCICGNSKTTVSGTSLSVASSLASLLTSYNYDNTTVEPKRLNIDPKEMTGGLIEADDKIKIGDLVRKSLS